MSVKKARATTRPTQHLYMNDPQRIVRKLLETEDENLDPKSELLNVNPDDLRDPEEFSYQDWLAVLTGTEAKNWEPVDGPQSGTGVDFWFVYEPDQTKAYVNDDQGYVTFEVGGENRYSGLLRDLEDAFIRRRDAQ